MSAEPGVTYSCRICDKDYIRKFPAAALDKEMGMGTKGLCSDACSKTEESLASVDMVNSPPHYKSRVPGLECIDVTQYFNFCLGNAIKYIWRADMKGGDQDLKKAIWYLQRELSQRVAAKKRDLSDG